LLKRLLNTALWVSDLIKFQIGDFVERDVWIKSGLWIGEEKRGKRAEVIINDQDALKEKNIQLPTPSVAKSIVVIL
jgi:hypothetical protein